VIAVSQQKEMTPNEVTDNFRENNFAVHDFVKQLGREKVRPQGDMFTMKAVPPVRTPFNDS